MSELNYSVQVLNNFRENGYSNIPLNLFNSIYEICMKNFVKHGFGMYIFNKFIDISS